MGKMEPAPGNLSSVLDASLALGDTSSLIPAKYSDITDVFDKKNANVLSLSNPYDCLIDHSQEQRSPMRLSG